MGARRIKLLYTSGAVIITSTAIILACGSDNTEAIVIDPPASIAPMIRITDDPESGGMPCVNPEQFQRFLNEQKASEESESWSDRLGTLCEDIEAVQPILETDPARAVESPEGAVSEPQTSEETGEALVEHTTATALESDAENPVPDSDEQGTPSVEKDRKVPETASEQTPIYLCHGQMLTEELQEYAYNTCVAFGVGFYYPHLICQMYQESGFRQSAVSPYGDYGLMQLKGIYHDYSKQLAGIPWADLINDPYANIYCGVALVAYYWNQCHDLNTTISAYNTGAVTIYNSAYVAQVRQHESALQQIR